MYKTTKNSFDDNTIKTTTNAIFKAVEQKDFKYLQKHITLENVNVSDNFGWTPLMSAAYCGHLDVVEFLLSYGANKKAKEKSGLTAAQLALKRNHLRIVALLRKRNEFTNNKIIVSDTSSLLTKNTPQMEMESLEALKYCKEIVRTNVDHVNEKLNQTSFYCKVCQRRFQETNIKTHEASIAHIFNSKPKLPNVVYGISKQNKGYQMLLNAGWDEEGGLGPSGKGVKYPVKTTLKIDRKGLGHSKEKDARITHFMSGDISAVNGARLYKQKPLTKRDREKLLNREARKERAFRIALS